MVTQLVSGWIGAFLSSICVEAQNVQSTPAEGWGMPGESVTERKPGQPVDSRTVGPEEACSTSTGAEQASADSPSTGSVWEPKGAS